jgi:hypothetical protein
MRSVLAGIRNFVVPWGARRTDPAVILEGNPEAILLASGLGAAVIWQYSPTGSGNRRAFLAAVQPGVNYGQLHIFATDFAAPLFKRQFVDLTQMEDGSGSLDLAAQTSALTLSWGAAGANPRITTATDIKRGSWTALTFANGWQYAGVPEMPCQYKVVAAPDKCLWIIGMTAPGASTADGTVVATLPVAVRPATSQRFLVSQNGAAGPGEINVLPNGNITIRNLVGTLHFEYNCFVSLDAT